jgi:hypothetical protein
LRSAAQRHLLTYGAGAAVLILLLLQAAFGRWRLALLMFITLPTALVGGLLAAYAGIGIISLGALIGFFTVMGIAARNGIMMIAHFQHLERQEGEPFGPAPRGGRARERLAPILMTASATGLALVPLALRGDLPGQEIEHPMAVVILGGLVTSTLVNLFVVPAVYLRIAAARRVREPSATGVRLPPPTSAKGRRFQLPLPVGGNGAQVAHDDSLPLAGNGALAHDDSLPLAGNGALAHDDSLPVTGNGAPIAHDDGAPVTGNGASVAGNSGRFARGSGRFKRSATGRFAAGRFWATRVDGDGANIADDVDGHGDGPGESGQDAVVPPEAPFAGATPE